MITGWVRHPSTTPSRSSGINSHVRSHSAAPKIPADLLVNRRAISTSALNSNSTTSLSTTSISTETSRRTSSYNDDDENMSTIPDPRTMPSAGGSNPANSCHHPDLSDEVATLSNKLINAINHQTNLDDTLNETRHQLDASRERIRQLELEAEGHASKIAGGLLLRSADVKAERKNLLASLAEEVRKRGVAEKEKAAIELELETLTTALFEEANKMVITAREEAQRAHEEIQRKNDQLKSQLADTLALLKSHQEQLAGLKHVMEQMSEEREDQTNSSAPPTPGLKGFDSNEAAIIPVSMHSSTGDVEVAPSYPTSFTHILQPILRNDLAAYDDFVSLVRSSKNTGSRASSGSYVGISLGLGLGGYTSGQPSPILQHTASNGSNSSLATSATMGSAPATPTTPGSAISAGGASTTPATPLKETRFYKRSLAEDIEPTLRLDAAPGLSWLARRSVLNAMCEGTLVVDPMPAPTTAAQKLYVFACSLCGESRKDKAHARTHRFRTSESETAQRYPLCRYCLGRVRSSCDFLGFLRMLKEGHWRCEDEDAEKNAWEESVRLREQMFWARMGGGVIPVGATHRHQIEATPRTSEENEIMKKMWNGEIQPRDITPVSEEIAAAKDNLDEAENKGTVGKKTASKTVKDDMVQGLWKAAQEDAIEPPAEEKLRTSPVLQTKDTMDGFSASGEKNASTVIDTEEIADEISVSEEKDKSNRSSIQSLAVSEPGKQDEKRLSITIPGSE